MATSTWPNCFSRANVQPDDSLFILGFPLDMVLNYSTGLCMSRSCKLWPNLTKLLNVFVKQGAMQTDPDFRYTTIQLNNCLPCKMHVDGNNQGRPWELMLCCRVICGDAEAEGDVRDGGGGG